MQWLHERICGFQTFKQEKVILESKEFLTMFRPDLFLTTVYGDWSKPSDEYFSKQAGNTIHTKECIFYVSENNYDKIDFHFNSKETVSSWVYNQKVIRFLKMLQTDTCPFYPTHRLPWIKLGSKYQLGMSQLFRPFKEATKTGSLQGLPDTTSSAYRKRRCPLKILHSYNFNSLVAWCCRPLAYTLIVLTPVRSPSLFLRNPP
jgi:hypothetical protein